MRSLLALAIVVAGGVGALAVYTFGWRDSGAPAAASAPTNPRVYTLRQGDVVGMPTSAVRCEATHEAGIPRLFCRRTRDSRYQVVINRDVVQVYDLEHPDVEPFEPTYSVPAARSR